VTDKVWTSADALAWTSSRFARAGIETARLDAELLLAETLNATRVDLYTHPERPLSVEERALYRSYIERRLAAEPVAYILGRKAFRYLTLKVTPAVLVPRPETELLVEAVLEFACRAGAAAVRGLLVADVGTGSGAVGISVAKEVEGSTVYATDESREALEVAKENAKACGVSDRVVFLVGNLLEPMPGEVIGSLDAVVSNPPYVSSAQIETLPREIRDHEPRGALDGGPDGLDVIRRLMVSAREALRPGGLLAIEIGEDQGEAAVELAQGDFERAEVRKDLGGHDRVLVARRRG